MSYQLGIIGAGNMAEAIVRGVLSAKVLASAQIVAADPSPARRSLFADSLNIATHEDAGSLASQCQAVLLSVKPQQMAEVLASLGPRLGPEALIISIAAGISTGFIEQHLGVRREGGWRIIRAMPNLPMLIGQGMVALCRGRHATSADLESARRLFAAAATVIEVEETQMNAVTAVSGSGPAYVFYLAEQMIRAGEELGLSPAAARTLSVQTILGAGKMLVESADSAEALRQKVTSPGGTTQAALEQMEQHRWGQITADAIQAAACRARDLGK